MSKIFSTQIIGVFFVFIFLQNFDLRSAGQTTGLKLLIFGPEPCRKWLSVLILFIKKEIDRRLRSMCWSVPITDHVEPLSAAWRRPLQRGDWLIDRKRDRSATSDRQWGTKAAGVRLCTDGWTVGAGQSATMDCLIHTAIRRDGKPGNI
jgi:hypothetical protein